MIMKEIDKFKNAFWVGSLYIYGLGLLALVIFYSEFGISLYPFFSLSDGIFYMIYTTLAIGLSMMLFEFALGIIYTLCTAKENEENLHNKTHPYLRWTLVLEAIFITIYLFLHIWFDWLYYWTILAILLIHALAKLYFYMRDSKDKGLLRFIFYCAVFILTLFICISSYSSARNIIEGESTTMYELATTDTLYSSKTTPDLFYIGESNNTIFLYDKKKNNTVIVNKDYVKEWRFVDCAYSVEKKEKDMKKFEIKVPK